MCLFWFIDLMSNFIQNNIDKQQSMQQRYWEHMVQQQQQQHHHGTTWSNKMVGLFRRYKYEEFLWVKNQSGGSTPHLPCPYLINVSLKTNISLMLRLGLKTLRYLCDLK